VPPTTLKLVTCPSLPAYILNQKKTLATNIALLAFTFTKLDDNLTNNDRDIHTDITLDVKYIALWQAYRAG